ncbi:MAG: OmpA family protein [Candidatus Cyclobacteriaceae bacterium M2_1C_046]
MIKTFGYAVIVGVMMMSCVSQKKYNELLTDRVQTESDLAECESNLNAASAKIAEMEAEIKLLKEDTTATGEELRQTEAELAELKEEHKKLETYYNNALSNSGKLNKDLAEQQQQLMVMRENLEKEKTRNEQLSADLTEREKKVEEMEAILKAQEQAVAKLKEKINNSLLGFKGSDLSVEVKDGKVYVSLAEQLLFGSGSTVVDANGKKALQQLANAIKGQTDLRIMVEGHTDDVPISGTSKYMKDNWDLSVMRATSIVRILTDAGVAPDQVIAAGKGEFSPVTTNETKEGRAKNRRTEIVITPDLSELFRLIEANSTAGTN